MCTDCHELQGGSTVYIDQPAQPFCQDCSGDNGCVQKLDSACVVYHLDNPQKPPRLVNFNLQNGVTAEQLFEKLDTLLGNNLNVPITAVDSSTVDLTASGASNHTLKADVKISTAVGNTLSINSDGLYGAGDTYKVKVNASDAPDYLANQVIGGSDGIVSTSVVSSGSLLSFIPSIDLVALVANLCTLSEFQDCIAGQIPDSPSGTTLIANDSSTIDFTTSGTEGHTLTGAVKVSATGGNQISINGDGLYVPAPTTSITASNGLYTPSTNIVRLGTNPIIEHTLLNGVNYDFAFNPRRLLVGNNYASAFGLSTAGNPYNKVSFNDTYTMINEGGLFAGAWSKANINAGLSLTSNAVIANFNSALHAKFSASTSIPNSVAITSNISTLVLEADPSVTVTVGQAGSGRTAAAIHAQLQLKENTTGTAGTVTHAAGIRVVAPYEVNAVGATYTKITNYYGLFIESSGDYLVNSGDITNKYGVYQGGTSDVNEFHGELKYYNGLTNASDGRVKNELSEYTTGLEAIKQVRPIVYKYNTSYQPESKTFVGVIAQEVEPLLPYAISQGINGSYTDFRFYDDKPLLYAIVNSIKELTGQTLVAYTSNSQSAAYTGATDGEAKLSDLNNLRAAYENLKAAFDDLRAKLLSAGIVN